MATPTGDPNYTQLLEIFKELISIDDPLRQRFEFDRAWKTAKRECGVTLLSSFRSMFEEYKKVQSTLGGDR